MQINPSEVTKILKEQIKIWRKGRSFRSWSGAFSWGWYR